MTATRTIECVDCGETVDANGSYTDPLGRRPGPETICGPCIEHLDARNWTKQTILSHLFAEDRGFYYTSGTTKAAMIRGHQDVHRLASERRARLLALGDTIAYLRTVFGCRLDDSGFACSDDKWIADHIKNHETGNTLGGLLL
jgi:hypothetical protein